MRVHTVIATGGTLLLASSLARAGGHGEIGVGRTTANRLVAHMQFPQPVPVPRSIYAGFGGYATGLIGFANVDLDDPAEDVYTISEQSSISVRLTGRDAGAAIFDGFPLLQVGESINFGPPFFDYHPIFSVPNPAALHGQTYALRLVLHDSTGHYTDSEEFTVTMTPAWPADFDLSNSIDVTDIFRFLAAWFAGDTAADFDRQSGLGVPDIFGFLGAWFASCP